MDTRLLHQAKISSSTKNQVREFSFITKRPIGQITEQAQSQYLNHPQNKQLLADHYQQRFQHLKGGVK